MCGLGEVCVQLAHVTAERREEAGPLLGRKRALVADDLLAAANVAPEVAGRVHEEDPDLDRLRQQPQEFAHGRRERGCAEDRDAPREGRRPGRRGGIGHDGSEFSAESREVPACGGDAVEQAAPQLRLPSFVCGRGVVGVERRLAVLPREHPVRPVHDVVVEYRREPAREFVQAKLGLGIAFAARTDIAADRCEDRFLETLAEDRGDRP